MIVFVSVLNGGLKTVSEGAAETWTRRCYCDVMIKVICCTSEDSGLSLRISSVVSEHPETLKKTSQRVREGSSGAEMGPSTMPALG